MQAADPARLGLPLACVVSLSLFIATTLLLFGGPTTASSEVWVVIARRAFVVSDIDLFSVDFEHTVFVGLLFS